MEDILNWSEHLRLYVTGSSFIRDCCYWRGYAMDLQLPQIKRAFWKTDLGWRSKKPEKLEHLISHTTRVCVSLEDLHSGRWW